MRNSRLIEGVSTGLILAALIGIGAATVAWPPPVDRPLHRALGAALAKEAITLAGGAGQIVVITRDTQAFPQPALDCLLGSFEKEIHRASLKIASVQKLQVDPLRPAEVPPGDFFQLIRRAPAGEVIVSLLGPPLLGEDQWRQLRPIQPKIVALCIGSIGQNLDLHALFEAGYVQAAVVDRPASSKDSPPGRPTARGFDQLYMTVTAADLSRLPASSPSSQ
jgi:hypothetical protein